VKAQGAIGNSILKRMNSIKSKSKALNHSAIDEEGSQEEEEDEETPGSNPARKRKSSGMKVDKPKGNLAQMFQKGIKLKI
jgi:hypothetical protein